MPSEFLRTYFFRTSAAMIIAAALSFALAAFAQPAPPAMDVYQHTEAGLEFSIKIPPKWKAEPSSQRYAVTLKPSSKADRIKLPKGMIADPSITVAAVRKPVSFTPENLDEVAKEIEESFVRYNGKGTGFQIFQKNILNDLPGGRSAFLYYVSFTTDGAEAGQAILITGNEKVRYRITLSDHRLNFDRNLELYYPYMVSIDFKGTQTGTNSEKSLSSEDLIRWGAMVIGAGIILGFLVRLKRSRQTVANGNASRQPSGYANSEVPLSMMEIAPETAVNAAKRETRQHSSSESSSVHPPSAAKDGPEYSMFPSSMIGVTRVERDAPGVSEVDPAFTARDLSAPPQSVPLSQVVDESSAPAEMKKRWQVFGNKKK